MISINFGKGMTTSRSYVSLLLLVYSTCYVIQPGQPHLIASAEFDRHQPLTWKVAVHGCDVLIKDWAVHEVSTKHDLGERGIDRLAEIDEWPGIAI